MPKKKDIGRTPPRNGERRSRAKAEHFDRDAEATRLRESKERELAAGLELRRSASERLIEHIKTIIGSPEHEAPLPGEVARTPRPERPRPWKGPFHRQKFTDVAKLKGAVRETCLQSLALPFRSALTDDDIRVLRPRETSGPSEAHAIYDRLRRAILDAHQFADRHLGQESDPASIVLFCLRGLPELPTRDKLPGYARPRRARGAFVRDWTNRLQKVWGRRPNIHELAELSLLLEVGPTRGYEPFATVAAVLDYEIHCIREVWPN